MALRLAGSEPALYRIAARAAVICAALSGTLSGTLWGTAAVASEVLAKQRNCLNCHALDRKVVGPALKQVAARYAGSKEAPAYLAEKIIKGGAGAWGPVAMAANPDVSKEEALRLAQWVLSLK